MSAPAGKNSIPVEKVLLQMDLSKGLDELSRPEVGGDQSKLVTRLENLVQDQSGAWVKRPGLTQVATGEFTPRNLFGLRRGLGATDSSSNLWHLSEGVADWVNKGSLPSFGVTGRTVATSISTQYQKLIWAVSNDTWDILFHEVSVGAGDYPVSAIMTVTDRESGNIVAKYDMASILTGAGQTLSIMAAFVRDSARLHIWVCWIPSGSVQPRCYVINHDTSTAWPASSGTAFNLEKTQVYINQAATALIYDIAQTATGTVVAAGSLGAYHLSTASVLTHLALPAANDVFNSLTTPNDGNVYYMVYNGPAVTNRVYKTTEADITATTGSFNQNVSGNKLWLASYYDGVDVNLCAIEKFAVPAGPPDPVLSTMGTRVWATTYAAATFVKQATLYSWSHASLPFEMGGKFYCQMFKNDGLYNPVGSGDSTTQVGGHYIVNLSDVATNKYYYYAGGATLYQRTKSLSPAVVLEPYNATIHLHIPTTILDFTTDGINLYRPFKFTSTSSKVSVGCAVRYSQRSSSFNLYTLDYGASNKRQSVGFGGEDIISGGAICQYDGWKPVETAFVDFPTISAVDSGVAGNVNGLVNYVAVMKSIDASGNVSYSRVSNVFSLTVANKKVTLYLTPTHVTKRGAGSTEPFMVVHELYRTASGGTQYFLCADSRIPPDALSGANQVYEDADDGLLKCTDNMLDATLIAQPAMFRQPGTANTSLDRYPPPGNTIVTQHKDRLFVPDATGTRVFYSSFYVDGEGPWFNPALVLQPHGGTGPITALVSMDGRLFVFKKDAIFVVDGDGPPENGGTGTEFTPPTRLATEFGCIDQRSVLLTTNGIMYRSERGIEILSRSLQVGWIGDRVQNTCASYPVTTGTVVDTSGRVHFYLAASESTTAVSGVELVYDPSMDCWSIAKYTMNGVADEAVQGVTKYDHNGTTRVVLCGPSASCPVYYMNEATGSDDGYYVPWTVETGYIRPAGSQGRYRIHDCLVLGKRRNNHQLKLSIDSDYDSYEKSETFQPDKMQRTLVEMNVQPKKDKPVLFRLKIEENYPLDSTAYPRGNGFGMDLLGICFQVSPLAGAQFVAPFRKG